MEVIKSKLVILLYFIAATMLNAGISIYCSGFIVTTGVTLLVVNGCLIAIIGLFLDLMFRYRVI